MNEVTLFSNIANTHTYKYYKISFQQKTIIYSYRIVVSLEILLVDGFKNLLIVLASVP